MKEKTAEKTTEKTADKNTSGNVKGLRIRTFSLWMVIGSILVSLLIVDGIINVMERHQDLAGMTKEYILAQDEVMEMSLGSNYLTEQARLYVVTKEQSYADAYFTEVDVTQRRDKAIREIETHLKKDEQTLQLSKDVLQLSNELMEVEIHAMKLAALSAGADMNRFSQRIRDYPLTDKELRYSKQEKSDRASQLVFGNEYQDRKRSIEEKLTSITKSVTAVCNEKQAESEKAMKNALVRQSFYAIFVVVLVILSYIMIAVLILRPIRIYINCIKNNNFLEITGAYEFKYLAATYNNVYEMSLEQQSMLRQKAECDALTGLLNRQAFEQLKVNLGQVSKPIVLLLIDIDVFKTINDTYGHESGDQALIRAADLLKDSFRTSDYVMRIGGDEFAVIMEKVRADQKKIISEKIDRINWELQHPEKDFPKYSISAGIAFSDKGYNDELFRQADKALYHTKENGRCGYAFFDQLE